MDRQLLTGFGHIAKGFQIISEALILDAENKLGGDPTPSHQDPVSSANATTAKAKKAADKAATKKAPAATEPEPEAETETKTETKEAAPKTEKKASSKKADEPAFESLDREGQIEHLRGRMVMVAQKLNGDRDKVYAFLKKYKAQKVNELSDENLVLLKEDIEVFLGGPDALDI